MTNYLSKKNVVGFGPGIKRKKGEVTGEEATLFFVEKKTSDISIEDRIPDRAFNKVTDVIEVGKVTPLLLNDCGIATRQLTIVPLRGGVQIGCESLSGVGTLGAIVQDRATGKLVALTNAHVAGNPLDVSTGELTALNAAGVEFTSGTAINEKMSQNGVEGSNQFGEVLRDVPGKFTRPRMTDCSISTIKSEFGVTPGIVGLTKYRQYFRQITTVAYGERVFKAGRTTGVTEGEIVSIGATILVEVIPGYNKEFREQVVILPIDPEIPFSGFGDSGAMICIDMGNGYVSMVAQLHAGTEDGSMAVASSMDEIVDALDIVPWDGRVIIDSDNIDVVSTGGAVFTRDNTTMLSVTNDQVCDGSVCGPGGLSIDSSYIPLLSCESTSWKSDLTIDATTIFVKAEVNADVGIEITLDSECGAESNPGVILQITLDSECNIMYPAAFDANVNVLISPNISADIGIGVGAEVNADVMLGATCESYAHPVLSATLDTDIFMAINADSMASVSCRVQAETDTLARVSVDLESLATVTGTGYNGGSGVVKVCGTSAVAPLMYGGSLPGSVVVADAGHTHVTDEVILI